MIKHVFINAEKLDIIRGEDKAAALHQLRQPIGFCYDDGKPRTMFVGTKRDNPEEVHLTKGGDLQFNLKPAREEEKEEVKAPPAGNLADRVDAALDQEDRGQVPPPADDFGGADADIPF